MCGMALEPVTAAIPPTQTTYVCPMHPEIVRSEPGFCPICGMALAPRTVSVEEEVNPERPLSERGRNDVERLAQFLAASGMGVQRLYHSGKLRARQTAELLAARIGSVDAIEASPGLNPNDAVEPIAERIAAWREDTLLVGHLPFMARLVAT